MDHRAWDPEYERILRRFGFSRLSDEESAQALRSALSKAARPLLGGTAEKALRGLLSGRPALLVGGGPATPRALEQLERSQGGGPYVVIAADGATTRCLAAGRVPDLIVTDLDGALPDEVEASRRGAMVLVHAHGDNRSAVEEWTPRFPGPVAGSCAGAPSGGLLNPGGFTDGDRALFVAEAYGATRARLLSYDFASASGEPVGTRSIKEEKLRTARELVDLLARRGRIEVEVVGEDGAVRPWSPR